MRTDFHHRADNTTVAATSASTASHEGPVYAVYASHSAAAQAAVFPRLRHRPARCPIIQPVNATRPPTAAAVMYAACSPARGATAHVANPTGATARKVHHGYSWRRLRKMVRP